MIDHQTLLIDKRYQTVRLLGVGGMGEVYLAEDVLLSNKRLAVKMIKKSVSSPEHIARFKQEFDVMTRLKHPYLVRVYDFGRDSVLGNCYITMDYVPSHTLKWHLEQKKPLPRQKTLTILVQLLRTLGMIHSRGILHRDIKPDNIMLTNGGIKVMDFGLAMLESDTITKTRGTLRYMAPEIINGHVDHRVDIYSCGATFFEMLTGKVMVNTHTLKDTLVLLTKTRKFHDFAQHVLEEIADKRLRDVIARMVAYEPEQRFQSCFAAIQAINDATGSRFPLETNDTREAYVLGAGLVDRKQEMALLIDKLQEHLFNHKLVLLRGRSGFGKSRMFQEFKKHCQLNRIRFLESSCQQDVSKTYAPFLDILNALLLNAAPDLLEAHGADLKKILPMAAPLQDVQPSPSHDPEAERGKMIQTIVRFILEDLQSKGVKTVIFISHIQWIREEGLDIINELLYAVSSQYSQLELRLYASLDEEYGARALKVLENRRRLYEVSLEPFGSGEILEYYSSMFGANNIDATLLQAADHLRQATQGIPFLIEELLRTLVSSNKLRRDNHFRWVLDVPSAQAFSRDPTHLVRQRLQTLQLNDIQTRCLEILSLLHDSISISAFSHFIVDRYRLDVPAFFGLLEEKEILTAEKVKGAIEYRFSQPEYKESIREGIVHPRPLYLFVAERLEELCRQAPEEYYEELAYNFRYAGARDKARYYLEQAAERAQKHFFNERAVELFEQLLELLPARSIKKRITVLHKVGDIQETIGHWPEALTTQRHAQELAERAGLPRLEAMSRVHIARVLFLQCQHRATMDMYLQALKRFETIKDTYGTSLCWRGIGHVYRARGQLHKAHDCFTTMLDIGRELDNADIIASAQNCLGALCLEKNQYEKANRFFMKFLQYASSHHLKSSMISAYSNLGNINQRLGKFDKAMAYFQKTLAVSREVGNKLSIVVAINNLANMYDHRGEDEKAIDCYNQVLAVGRELNEIHLIGTSLNNRAAVYRKQGLFDKAIADYRQSLAISRKLKDPFGECLALNNLGATMRMVGDYENALLYYDKAMAKAHAMDDRRVISIILGNKVMVLRKLKRYAEAEQAVDKGIAYLREIGLDYDLANLLCGKTSLRFKAGDIAGAKQANQETLALAQRVKREDSLFTARIYEAQIAHGDGRQADALELLERLIADTKRLNEKAKASQVLYKLSGLEDHRQRAIAFYQDLYARVPSYEYKEALSALGAGNQASAGEPLQASHLLSGDPVPEESL